jgi:hypothetical protein
MPSSRWQWMHEEIADLRRKGATDADIREPGFMPMVADLAMKRHAMQAAVTKLTGRDLSTIRSEPVKFSVLRDHSETFLGLSM